MQQTLDFFLGCLAPGGFRGWFPELAAQPRMHLYLLKAGPGCGKSTLMRRLAAQSTGPVERIHCSSDPDSLDGVIFPDRHAAVLDATAPHALEPDYPGVRQTVIDLYHTLDGTRLRQSSGQVLRLTDEARSLQAQAARELTAAAGLLAENRRAAAALTDRAGVLRCAQRLAAREFPRTGHAPSEQIRLLSAVTPKGLVVFEDTVPALARRIIVLHDEYGAVSRLFLAQLRTSALERGHHILSCRCPLAPDDSWEHLFLPEAGVAVLTSNQRHPFRFEGQKNIHCTRFMDADGLRRRRERLTFGRRAADRLLRETSSFQREAKAVHDRLETLYQQATDFSGVDAVCARLEQELHLN